MEYQDSEILESKISEKIRTRTYHNGEVYLRQDDQEISLSEEQVKALRLILAADAPKSEPLKTKQDSLRDGDEPGGEGPW